MAVLLAIMLCSCKPVVPGPGASIAPPSPTPAYSIAGQSATITPNMTTAFISPSILPSLSPAPTKTPAAKATPAKKAASTASASAREKAMQRDIDALISRSDDQQGQEQNYKNLKKKQLIKVASVNTTQIKFAGKPQVFKGDYTERFTPGKSYPYFADADIGGKRYYNVKDNFGVWVVFKYTVPI